MALLAPVIGEISWRVFDHPYTQIVEGPGTPERLAGFARMLRALDAFPIGCPEGYFKHKHALL
jgi:hypothetical protein